MKYLIYLILFLLNNLYAHIDQKVLYEFEAKCMICHNTYKKNDTAPPVVAVQQMYMRNTSNNKDISKQLIARFLAYPTHKKALMKPAIELYGLMPQQNLSVEQIANFAQVIIDTEFEVPDWFDGHYKSHKFKKNNKNNIP